MKILATYFLTVLSLFSWLMPDKEPAVLRELDKVISERDQRAAAFREREKEFKELLKSSDYKSRCAAADSLVAMYHDALPDSANLYAARRYALYKKGGTKTDIMRAKIDVLLNCSLPNLMSSIAELEEMDYAAIDSSGLTRMYLDAGTMMCYRAYGHIADNDMYDKYEAFFNRYCSEDSTSFRYAFMKAREMRRNGRNEDIVNLLLPYLEREEIPTVDCSVLSTYIAGAYETLGDVENAEYWYAKAAICDLKSNKHHHMALARLADILVENGDELRALAYVMVSNEENIVSNSPTRISQTSSILARISDHVVSDERRKRVIISSLLLFVVVLLVACVAVLARTIRLTRNLEKLNKMIKSVNRRLDEANILKENYLSRYMVKASVYIKKVDAIYSKLRVIQKEKGEAALQAELRKPSFSSNEYKNFYKDFDETFLSIFPNFLEMVNRRSRPEFEWKLGRNGSLPMELRLLAVMRVGITRNEDISEFLNFPISSIYTYKYRLHKTLKLNEASMDSFVNGLKI